MNLKLDLDFKNTLYKLFDNSNNQVFVLDELGKVEYANASFLQLLNKKIEDVQETHVFDLFDFDKSSTSEIKKTIVECESHNQLQMTVKDDFGKLNNPLKLTLSHLKYFNKNYFLGNVFADGNRGNEPVPKGEFNFKQIYDNQFDAAFRLNNKGEIIYANKAFLSLFQLENLDEILNEPFDLFLKRKIRWTMIQAKLADSGRLENERIYFRSYDGEVFLGLLNGKLSSAEGRTYFDGIIALLPEGSSVEELLAEKNEELEKTNAQLDRFLYSTSHDLRGPLTSLMGLVNLMRKETTSELMQTYVEQVSKSTHKLDNVIKDMISFAKNAHQKVKSDKISFEKMVNDALLQFQYHPNFNKINFVINIDEQLPFYSDSERIESIFNHLFKNGISFMDPSKSNPYIRIDVNVYGEVVIIEIVDNGIGISRTSKGKVFEMFYRGSEQSTGSGLGLYLVKETIERLSGRISLETEIGHGSIFHIEIPNGTKGKLMSKKLKLYGTA